MNTIIKASQTEGNPDTPKGLSYKIVSHPAGDCPYFLLRVSQSQVDKHELSDEVVEDTADFFADYDLTENEEEE